MIETMIHAINIFPGLSVDIDIDIELELEDVGTTVIGSSITATGVGYASTGAVSVIVSVDIM